MASQALKKLGENLAIARVRRRETQRAWAQRLGVSVPTLIRLERGDPGVGIGIVATALWMLGRAQALPDLADPGKDRGALEREVREGRFRQDVYYRLNEFVITSAPMKVTAHAPPKGVYRWNWRS